MKTKTVRAIRGLACTGSIAAMGACYSGPVLANEFYTADSGNATISTVGLSASLLGNAVLLTPSALTAGSYNFKYAAIEFTPTASGTYYFGQTSSPSDTVMILYSGIYDPTNPGTGALVGNDDTSQAQHQLVLGDPSVTTQCGPNINYCPQIAYSVTAGQTYTLWVSSYSTSYNNVFDLPFQYYSTGEGVFSAYDGRSPIDLMRPFYLASELGVTVDPIFVGGTLKVDHANVSQDFTLANMASNTIDQNGIHSNFSGVFSDAVAGHPGYITIVNSGSGGSVTFSGINTYTGPTTVNGGTLDVEGSIASSSLTAVNAGGALMGAGTVGNTLIGAGGILAPGNGTSGSTMSVAGDLAFQSGAQYVVQLNPNTSSLANVSGTATLGGATVNAVYANGSYVEKQYTILTAAGGVSGTFDDLVNTNLPSDFYAGLSYDTNNAYLNLTLSFGLLGDLNQNQQNVGDALVDYFNRARRIPGAFGALTPAGLTQISGELATGTQQVTFDAMNQFMGVMTDQSGAGRDFAVCDDVVATKLLKAPQRVDCYVPHWSVWAAGYGGGRTTDGNAIIGSNSINSHVYGGVVGADYRISPDTRMGFALAGGGTNFSVGNALGSGRSDLFQAGAFIHQTIGAAYLTSAVAYGWQDITTNRTLTVAGIDRLQANFNANAFSGRLEGGYRFAAPGMGLTPYAAAQLAIYDLPGYAEQALVGANMFALNYDAKAATASRSELGLRTDKSFDVQDAVLTLRGRAAWAHNFDVTPSIAANFQTLPGASFVVSGASIGRDAALTTASAEMTWRNGLSLAATFDGEFSDVTRSYTGRAVLRYQW